MNITTGFIFLFISIIIPGFLFLRFYYFGEFSKQFTTKENILKTLVFAMIPGLIIQSICLSFYLLIFGNLQISQLFILNEELVNDQKGLSEKSLEFVDKLPVFLCYSLTVYLFSLFKGYLTSRIVRYFRLDRKFKILRFRNQWFYIFSGEIFHFQKFVKAANVLAKPDLKNETIQMVNADILIESGGKQELYSGIVVDYELDSSDISKLDKLYLFDAHRYKIQELKSVENNLLNPMHVEKKLIPGAVFVLSMENVVNINVSYVVEKPSFELSAIRLRRKNQRRRNISYFIVLPCLAFGIFLLFNWNLLPEKWMINKWYDKLVFLMVYIQIMRFAIPLENKKGMLSWAKWLGFKFSALIFWLIIFYFVTLS